MKSRVFKIAQRTALCFLTLFIIFNVFQLKDKNGFSNSVSAMFDYLDNFIIETGKGKVTLPETDSEGKVILYSPYKDNLRGMNKMCEVTCDYAETVCANSVDDKSNPEYTPLIKGTFDYVKGEAVYDGVNYYILSSGLKVEADAVNVFDGYILPTNTLSVYKNYTYDGTSRVELTLNWKVPFTATLKTQSYFTGYSEREFNVASFTSRYIDFVFRYTNAAEGKIKFPLSSVVSRAEWIDVGENGTTTLRVHLKNAGEFYGYKAYYSENNRLVLEFNEKPKKHTATVLLDAGHGGTDCGAIGVNGVYESELNLSLALSVKTKLENYGYKVVMSRTDNSYKSLEERQNYARKSGANVFVSLHHNSSENASLSGTEAYYYRAFSKPLAQSIHNRLVKEWKGIYIYYPEMFNSIVADDGGVRYYPFKVTRIEECPAVLIECGYLSNAAECEYLTDTAVSERLADAISQGINDYFENV